MQNKEIDVTCIGDSTFDNRAWVDGLIASYIKTRLHIPRDTTAQRVEKYNNNWIKPSLSVIENLTYLMPNSKIHDYTNDGFTTTDVLKGNRKDKVFPIGAFSFFPPDFFRPLEEAKNDIKNSQYIVLSVGGNNFREFLMSANAKPADFRNQYIQDNIHKVFKRLRDEYIEIVKQISNLNKDAKIILMTQYYPSVAQKTYGIYQFMQEIGEILNIGGPSHDPLTVIHTIMKMTYTQAFAKIAEEKIENIIVADITSSINPFDKNNHVSQIEPSGIGGQKIARMLKYIITNTTIQPGNAFRFLPKFFDASESDIENNNSLVVKTPIANWIPMHPNSFKSTSTEDTDQLISDSYLLVRLSKFNTQDSNKLSASIFKLINNNDRFTLLMEKIKAIIDSYLEGKPNHVKKNCLAAFHKYVSNKGFLGIYSMETPGYQTPYQSDLDRLITLLENKTEDEQAKLLLTLYSYYQANLNTNSVASPKDSTFASAQNN